MVVRRSRLLLEGLFVVYVAVYESLIPRSMHYTLQCLPRSRHLHSVESIQKRGATTATRRLRNARAISRHATNGTFKVELLEIIDEVGTA